MFSGLGFAYVLTQWRPVPRGWAIGIATLSLAITPVIYPAACAITRHFHLLGSYSRNKPYRDDYRYLFIPWGIGENSAQRMSALAVELASPYGVIFTEDLMASFAVEYQRLERNRPGLKVVSAAEVSDFNRFSGGRGKVVFVPAAPARPPVDTGQLEWTRVGDLYELRLRPTTRPVDAETGPRQPKEL